MCLYIVIMTSHRPYNNINSRVAGRRYLSHVKRAERIYMRDRRQCVLFFLENLQPGQNVSELGLQ